MNMKTKGNTWKKVLAIVGAVIAPLFLLLLIIAAAVTAILSGYASGGQSQSQYGSGSSTLSESVLAYQPNVTKYCSQYGITDYITLVLAVMQQESGGSGNDPMQCSESPLNTKYPNKPDGITEPDYSIEVGTEYLANCLKAAKCKSPTDIQGISLALQGYNFGGGYIDWALKKGGYTETNATEFSKLKVQELGYKSYGDTDYVSHVLRYYLLPTTTSEFAAPLLMGTYTISRGYGYDNGNTDIYASADGTVVFAGFGKTGSGYGGYGNVVKIKHDDTYSTLYGHCCSLLVKTGQKVKQGEIIALVGSTGDSTGNHCHFELRVNDVQVNPASYIGVG